MLVSHSHRFIFIHVHKTGGTSVRAALEPYAELPGWPLWQRVRLRLGRTVVRRPPPLGWHARALDVRASLPAAVYDGYFKFAFVRNPWDWQVSVYHYIGQHPEHHQHAAVSRLKDFEAFLSWRIRQNRDMQMDFLTDAGGRLLVDFLGRFENLPADFAAICSTIGLRPRLRHLNGSWHADYRSYYTARTRRLVEEHWREDIEFFGYRFDPEQRPGVMVRASRTCQAPVQAAGCTA
jgi:hypothetical protein